MLEIRPFRSADEAEVTALLRESWLVHWAPYLPAEAVERFRRDSPADFYVRSMGFEFKVAVERSTAAKEVVGMVHVVGNLIGAVHVRVDRKGQGIGSALLDWAEGEVAAAGFPQSRLEVRAFNEPARRFYARRGWVASARYQDIEMGIPVETIEMVKALARSAPR